MANLNDVAQAFFPWLLRATEVAARAVASAVRVRDPKQERMIQFLVFVLVACPLVLLALAALVATGLKWFFYPKAHLDLEFETGDSRLISVASPFVTLPDATFDVEFEWGHPSAPNFTLLPAGGQS